MSHAYTAAGVVALALALGACATHEPRGVGYDRGVKPESGATAGSASGAVSGGPPKQGEKEQRGNTPPGVDRDGHGPAAGAIVDPTGAVTGKKP